MTQFKRSTWGSPSACLRIAVVCLLPVLLATCGEDGPGGPSGPPVIGQVEFTSGPFTSNGYFGPNLPINRVHVRIVRPPSDVLRDTTRAFDPNLNRLRFDLPVLLTAAAESLDVTLELLNGTTVLFSGTSRLEAHAGPPGTTPPPAIPLIYSGPGSQITQLSLSPLDSMLGQGDSLIMQVTGLDAGQLPVTAFYVGWSSSDTAVARVNGAGVVRGRVPRGTVYIRAKTPDTQTFPSGIIESTTVTLVPDPATLIKVGGDNQTAAIGTTLPQMLAVEVRAGDNLPIAGIQVAFATADPGASVDSAIATTDANGVARTHAVLGTGTGPQSFTASVPGTATVTFNATSTAAPTPTWTGAVSFDWNNAGNWNTGVVPGGADSVTIPAGTPNSPDLTSNASIAALLNNNVLNLGNFSLTLDGNLRGTGSISGSSTSNLFVSAPATLIDHVAVTNLVVSGASVALVRNMNVSGNLTVTGNPADLFLNGHTVTVTGDFATQANGTLSMTNAPDTLRVLDDVLFSGGSTFGRISTGVILIGGDFTQQAGSSARSYAPTGNHLDAFIGAAVQTITFATPGSTASNFETLGLANSVGGVTLASDLFLAGPVGFAAGVPRIAHGSGQTLFVAELRAANATLDNILVAANNVLLTQFDSINFINYSSTATPLTISHPGSATPFVMNDLSFGVTPTSGNYISLTDISADANVLTVNMVNPTPGASGGFVQTAGGAVVNWPFIPAGARTWTGAVNTDWFTPGNWSPAGVPASTDDVVIPATATQPVLIFGAGVHNLTIQSGATLTAGGDVDVTGNAIVNGSFLGSSGIIVMSTHGTSVSGNISNLEIDLATRFESILVSGALDVSGLIEVLRGHFDVGGNTVTTGDFATITDGILKMVNPAGTLIVNGDADFGGEDPTGVLTAGTIRVRGNFAQLVGVTQGSFVASGTSRVVLDGTGPQVVTFTTPASNGSRFQDLEIANTADTVFLGSSVFVSGQLIKQLGGTAVITGAAQLLTTSGAAVFGLEFNNARVALGAGAFSQFDNVSWTGFASSVTQFTVARPSGTFVFSGHTFTSTPTSGFYLRADDTNPSDGQPLTINMVSATPATPGGFVQTAGGAVVNWPPSAGGAVTWTGASSTDWSNPANWSTNAVPTFADSVVIPAGGNQPSLTAGSFVGALLLANGTLTVNGQTLAVAGNFYTTGTGRLVMTNPADGMSIGGNATFNGGTELTFMTTGAIIFGGDLVQLATNSPDSYHPSGTHTSFFTGSGTQTISFATPGLVPGTSHLQEMVWAGTSDMVLASDVNTHGIFTIASSTSRTISGAGRVLTVGGFNSSLGLTTFDNVRLVINQATPSVLSLNNLAFVNQDPTAIQLQVGHPGAGGAFPFSNLTFSTVPTTGLYLSAIDLNASDGFPFTIDMVNPTPATPGAFVQAVGSVINWPAAGGGGTSTWIGSADSDWNNPANWQGGLIPSSADNVVIPAGMPNYPSMVTNEIVADMVVLPGAQVAFIDGFLEVTGDLTGGGSMVGGGPEMSGLGKFIQMADLGGLLVTGDITANADLDINGNLDIIGVPAHFDINGHIVNAQGLQLLSSGTIQMTVSGSTLNVTGDATFDGGPLTGLMTQGTLTLFGNFTQLNSSTPNSFRTGPLFTTVFLGSSPQTITMADSLQSHFSNLALAGPGGVIANSLIFVQGNLDVSPFVQVFATDSSIQGTGFDVRGDVTTGNGSHVQVGRLYLAGNLSVGGTWATASVIFQGTTQTAPILPYRSVFVQVGDVTFAPGAVSMNSLTVASGSLNLGGRTSVNGNVFITGGTLKPNSRTLAITGALNVQSTGTLTMQNALDSVLVTGFAGFGGGSSVGLMTDGVLRVGGSFTQTSGTSNTSFAASGNHKTIIGAAAVRIVNFATPGTGGAGSHFGNVDVTAGSGDINLSSNMVADGAFISAPTGTAPTIVGGGKLITAMSLNVTRASGTSIILENAPLIVNEQGTTRTQVFDRAAFSVYPSNATLLDLTFVGNNAVPRSVTFVAPNLQTSVTSPGLYAKLVSSNAQSVTLTVSGSNDPTGGPSKSNPPFGTTVSGATIIWQ